jgi:hypothetical protein
MTKANIAATINQPERPKKYVNIRCEELQIYPKEEEYNGSTRIKSPATRIIKDTMIKNKGILLKLVKLIIFPTTGGSISDKYNAIVSPMNPMAIL